MFRHKFLVASAVFTLAALSACSSSSQPEPEDATEVKETAGEIVDTPSDELFDLAKAYYSSGMTDLAKSSFASLKDSYPFGPYAEFAETKIADCEFNSGIYAAAAVNHLW